MPRALTIGEVARETGVPAKTIRYYEGVGALPPAERTAAGYRRYTRQHLERVRFVGRARALGLPVQSLRTLAAALDGTARGDVRTRLLELVRGQLVTVRQRRAELETLERDLRQVRRRLRHGAPPRDAGGCRCLGR